MAIGLSKTNFRCYAVEAEFPCPKDGQSEEAITYSQRGLGNEVGGVLERILGWMVLRSPHSLAHCVACRAPDHWSALDDRLDLNNNPEETP